MDFQLWLLETRNGSVGDDDDRPSFVGQSVDEGVEQKVQVLAASSSALPRVAEEHVEAKKYAE